MIIFTGVKKVGLKQYCDYSTVTDLARLRGLSHRSFGHMQCSSKKLQGPSEISWTASWAAGMK